KAIRETVCAFADCRYFSSPVASYCNTSDPYRKPSVHSVQPRTEYFPLTVNTGEPLEVSYSLLIRSIFLPDRSQKRLISFFRSSALSWWSTFILFGWYDVVFSVRKIRGR